MKSRRRSILTMGPIRLCALLLALVALAVTARAGETVRVAVLKFGTVNWQLDSLKANGFDRARGFDLEVLPLAGKNATAVALQADEVDMIVTDWIWALRQRAAGLEVFFVPYSTVLGALMLRDGLEIADLRGYRACASAWPAARSTRAG